MPTGKGFKGEFLLSIKLKCLAAPWLPSPTQQKVKLKASFKKTTQKARYKIAPTTMPVLNVGRGFSPTKHRAKIQNVAINDDLQKSFMTSVVLHPYSYTHRLPSPTRQKVKLKASIKKTTLKARYKIAPTTVPALNVGRGFSPTKHRAKTHNVAINDDLQKRLKLLISPCAKVTLLRNVYFAR
jgi:hypothetical protein